ncbi:endolytic transglycosylase MltG [Streptomyces sp. NPDC093225]|uniref:endolytic transglycosylase MltG n=1 Tax=Streptomyces sp. NPDC093225 TaxID=3366034 RepID=UPI00380A6449
MRRRRSPHSSHSSHSSYPSYQPSPRSPGTYRPWGRPPRRRARLTRRGRLAVILGLVLATGCVLVVTLLPDAEPPEQPRRLLIPEGWRAVQVYAAVDEALGVPPGTARSAVPSAHLALPPEARGNPEGYLFPATYPVTSKSTPASLLAYMVDTANRNLAAAPLAAAARAHGMTPYQTATLASIVEAEAETPADMGKVARVVHNRLARSMPLQMDSTLNYALRRHTVDTTLADTRIDSPFNTYERRGLPPTPIGSPGLAALRAAVAPTAGNWLFFVTVGPGDTRFSATYEEHRRHVADFNARRSTAAGTPPAR